MWAPSLNIVTIDLHRCQNWSTLVTSSQKQSQLRLDKNQSSTQRPVRTSGQWTSLGCSDIGFPVTALGGKRRPGLIVLPAPVSMLRCGVTWVCNVCTVNHAAKPPLPSVIIVWFSGCSYSNVGLFFSSPELGLHSVWCGAVCMMCDGEHSWRGPACSAQTPVNLSVELSIIAPLSRLIMLLFNNNIATIFIIS